MFGRSAVGALTLDSRDAVSIELMRGETQYAHLANCRFELFGQFDAIADDSFHLGVDSVHSDLYGPCEPTFRHQIPAENGYAPSSLACNEDNADKAKCVARSQHVNIRIKLSQNVKGTSKYSPAPLMSSC